MTTEGDSSDGAKPTSVDSPVSNGADLQRVLALCDEALLKPEEERADFVADACGDDESLRLSVNSLLMSVGASSAFMEVRTEENYASLIGQQIGDYRILERLGEGGMGSVYLAEREGGEFEQRVAIKIVRRYMMSQELVQRFDSERQLLAGLHHPYVAQLIDGGTTDDGVPYLVMEYIDGQRIDEYCDDNTFTLDQRIELLKKVAVAVQAAHKNLIVHRDLKPANVLVTHDGIPKLLDFGIAKLIDPAGKPAAGHTTMFGHMPMTPDYSSPEQILEGTVTTASDIYSLGVLAYELLTGTRPYTLNANSHPRLMKSVETLSIEKPSGRLERRSRDEQTIWASRRSTSPQQLVKDLAGDLDRILLKALHKDPQQRYESVDAFVRDLDRYSNGLPVEARDDTLGYRVSKFVGRNKLKVGAATVTMLAVVAGLGFSLWQAGIARDQSIKAQAQLQRAEAVSQFLGDVLLSPSVNWDGALQAGPNARIADVLTLADKKLDSELEDYPEVRVELYHKISEALGAVDQMQASLDVQNKAFALAEDTLPRTSPLRVDAYYRLATSLSDVGQLDEAIGVFEQGLALADEQSDTPTLIKLYLMNDLALTYAEGHQYEKARVIMQDTIDAASDVLGPGLHPPHTLGYANLGSIHMALGQLDVAERHYKTGLEAHALYPDQTQSIGAILHERYARLAIFKRDYSDARARYETALELNNAAFGIPNTTSAETKMRLAHVLVFLGELDQARGYIDEVEQDYGARLDYDSAWIYHLALGHLRLARGETKPALAAARKAMALGYEIEMSRFDRTDTMWLLVRTLRANGESAEAERVYGELITTESTWMPEDTAYKRSLRRQSMD
ncbi:MAG: serine/threonine-protein kinase [Pseudomonadota bacterium]